MLNGRLLLTSERIIICQKIPLLHECALTFDEQSILSSVLLHIFHSST